MKRKLLSFLLVMIMLVTNASIFVTSYAASTGTFTVSSVSGKAGETVTVNVSISNNPGIVATKLSFSYDKAILTLLSVEDKGLLGTGSFVAGNNLSLIPYSVTWEDSLSSTNHTSNGVIASLTFKISDTAAIGTYPITISYDTGSTFDTNLNDVKFNTVNGSVTVSCTHSWGSWTTTTAATCTKDGVQTRTCSTCKATETKAISATGHTVVTDKAVAATCTTAGKTEGSHCSKCNTVITAQQTIAALGHSWGSWATTTAATCTKDGVQTRTCATCKATETKAITKTGHTVVTDKAVAATCTTAGKTEGSHCSKCNAVITAQQTVAALGHSWGSWTTTTVATCTKDGVQTRTCSRCKATETKAIAAIDHSYNIFAYNQTEHPHYAVYKCECGKESVSNEINKDDSCTICNPIHTHSPKTVRVEPTCTVNGMEYVVCGECGETIGDAIVIAPLGHSYGEWVTTTAATCTKDGVQTRTCSKCNATETKTISATGHSFGEWVTVIEATTKTEGKEERTCSACGGKESRIIPKLPITIKDVDSGIELVFPDEAYDADVVLEIEEVFDGKSFQIVDTIENVSNTKIFDIKTTINGVEVQPATSLTVRIPIPAGYDPSHTFIYHINTETGKVENMKAKYENGYLVFETTHFSYYSIVEIKVKELVSIEIETMPAKTAYRYKEEVSCEGLKVIAVYSDESREDVTDKVTVTGFDTQKPIGDKTATVEYEGCTVTFNYKVSYNWWQWIIRILLFGWIWY